MNKTRLVNTFLQLVRLSSPSGQEENVRNYVIQELEKLGMKYKIDSTGNVYSSTEGTGDPILLCAHLDTVQPCEDINPKVNGKYISTDGKTLLGADNKAAVAAILETLQSNNSNGNRNIEVIFSVKEESEGGINFFNTKLIKSKSGLVADSELPVGTIILSSPSISDFEIIIKGKSTHTSTPDRGKNALTAAVSAIHKTKWGKIDSDSTINIGIINGGNATNTVPDEIVLKGEVRSFNKKSFSEIISKVKEAFNAEAKKHGVSVLFKEFPYCEGYTFSKDDKWINQAEKSILNLGLKLSYRSTLGGSDANYLNSKGIKVVNIGDGAENIHTTRERISIDSLIALTKVFIAYSKLH